MAETQPGLLLAICTANICRSPMVEALLAHALKAETGPLRDFRVASAGVAARNGERPSPNSVTALKKVGLDISGHRSQELTPELLSEATAVFVMTESHRDMIHVLYEPTPENIFLLREFMPPGNSQQIADPYGGSLPDYEACRDEIVEAIPSVMAFLRRELS